MYRSLLILTMASFSGALSGSLAANEEAPCCGATKKTADARRDEPAKARRPQTGSGIVEQNGKMTRSVAKINTRRLRVGMNLVGRNSAGARLYVKATQGRLLEYVIKDSRGRLIRTKMTSRTRGKATTCWSCGVDEAGSTHCWQVPCPVIVGPWKPKVKLPPSEIQLR